MPTNSEYNVMLRRAVVEGYAYRASGRSTLADGEEYIVHIDPVEAGGTVHIETPAVDPSEKALIDVYENADPGTNAVDGLHVHNMRYDSGDGAEQPEATVTRVADGGLDTTNADQTEETIVRQGGEYQTPGGEESRAIWRTIPVGETVTFVITDDSGGSNNDFSFDTVVYEGARLPQ